MTLPTAFCTLALLAGAGGLAGCDSTHTVIDYAGGAPGTTADPGAGGTSGSDRAGGTSAVEGDAGGAGGTPAISCSPPASATCVQPAPSFAATITPILDRSCNTCHSDGNPDDVWPLQDWSDVAAWSDLIISDLVNCTMPPADSNTPFPESDRQLIFAWLACGSPDN